MIGSIKGKIILKTEKFVLVETNGVGYKISVSPDVLSKDAVPRKSSGSPTCFESSSLLHMTGSMKVSGSKPKHINSRESFVVMLKVGMG